MLSPCNPPVVGAMELTAEVKVKVAVPEANPLPATIHCTKTISSLLVPKQLQRHALVLQSARRERNGRHSRGESESGDPEAKPLSATIHCTKTISSLMIPN
jgi:hypothetical protein